MNIFSIIPYIFLLVISIFIFYYNKFIKLKNYINETKSNIDVILKQRFDTLNNLINTVKGYMNHEKEIFMEITHIRNQLKHNYLTPQEEDDLNDNLSKRLPTLLAQIENYPELKSNENFLHLQKTIVNLEENLSASRRTYNSFVTDYNISIQTFPATFFAKIFGYSKLNTLYINENEKTNLIFSKNLNHDKKN